MHSSTIDRATEARHIDPETKAEAERHAQHVADAMIKNVHRDPRFYVVSALKNARAASGSAEANYLIDKFKAGHDILNDVPAEAKTHLDELHNTLQTPSATRTDNGQNRPREATRY